MFDRCDRYKFNVILAEVQKTHLYMYVIFGEINMQLIYHFNIFKMSPKNDSNCLICLNDWSRVAENDNIKGGRDME